MSIDPEALARLLNFEKGSIVQFVFPDDLPRCSTQHPVPMALRARRCARVSNVVACGRLRKRWSGLLRSASSKRWRQGPRVNDGTKDGTRLKRTRGGLQSCASARRPRSGVPGRPTIKAFILRAPRRRKPARLAAAREQQQKAMRASGRRSEVLRLRRRGRRRPGVRDQCAGESARHAPRRHAAGGQARAAGAA